MVRSLFILDMTYLFLWCWGRDLTYRHCKNNTGKSNHERKVKRKAKRKPTHPYQALGPQLLLYSYA